MPKPQPWNQTAATTRVDNWTAKTVENAGSSGNKLVEETFPAYRLKPEVLLKALKEVYPDHIFRDEEPIVKVHS